MAFDYKEKFSVAGKKCIVTGAAQGLSRGMAEGLLENGAEVVLMDLQAEKSCRQLQMNTARWATRHMQ